MLMTQYSHVVADHHTIRVEEVPKRSAKQKTEQREGQTVERLDKTPTNTVQSKRACLVNVSF